MTPAQQRVHELFDGAWSLRDLIRFHSANKLLLMAHSPSAYRNLGQLVAGAHALDHAEVATRYSKQFLEALEIPVSPGRHVNVLQHAAGHFKKQEANVRAELSAAIDAYRLGSAPLAAPIGLLRRYALEYDLAYLAYLASQTYLIK
jgi:uncharacterized protein YbgA (DUF1722 family)